MSEENLQSTPEVTPKENIQIIKDFKFDVEKIKAIKEKKEKSLKEVMEFLYSSFEQHEAWAKINPFQQYCLVEQAFLFYFASFPSRLMCAAALAALDDDKFYADKPDNEKLDIRKQIQAISLKMKLCSDKTSFAFSFDDYKSMILPLLEAGLDKRIFVILLGKERYTKLAKKSGKFQIS